MKKGETRCDKLSTFKRTRELDGQERMPVEAGNIAEQTGSQMAHKVLGIQELLEKILSYAVWQNDGCRCCKNITNLRLVQKNWNQAVFNALVYFEEPLYKLKLSKQKSHRTRFVTAHGNLLDQFISFWQSSCNANHLATVGVQIKEDFFRMQNYNIFDKFLRLCGSNLLVLEISIPQHGGSLPCVFSKLKLSVLKRLSFSFSAITLKDMQATENPYYTDDANVIHLMQSFLSGSESLKKLDIVCESPYDNFPRGTHLVGIPQSVTNLTLNGNVCSQELEIVLRNQLPHLTTLKLQCEENVSSDVLFQVLYKLRSTSRCFTFYEFYLYSPPRLPQLVSFPVMETLEKLDLQNIHYELKNNHPRLETCFPKLRNLALYEQTPEMMKKWIFENPMPYVEILEMELVDENVAQEPCNTLPLSQEITKRACVTFASVRSLSLSILGTETAALKHIFMEMRQLSELLIEVSGSNGIVDSLHWDSLLIGVPIELLNALRAAKGFWKKMDLEDNCISIKMLFELRTLRLYTASYEEESTSGVPLISDLTFILALLEMPKLWNLELRGRFCASEAMTEEWKKKGGSIKYFPESRL